MRLFTLFISYRSGLHYCGVYPTMEYLYGVIREMTRDMKINKSEIPKLNEILNGINGNSDDYYHEFSDGTWINIQETSEQLIEAIKDTYGAAHQTNATNRGLVRRAARNARPHKPGKWPRWSAATECLAVGSTTAIELCRRFRLDPNELLDGPICEHCAKEAEQNDTKRRRL